MKKFTKYPVCCACAKTEDKSAKFGMKESSKKS